MRALLCAAALVVLGASAVGEPIIIHGVIANYDSASDCLVVQLHSDRPIDLLAEQVLIGNAQLWSSNVTGTQLTDEFIAFPKVNNIRVGDGTLVPFTNTDNVLTIEYDHPNELMMANYDWTSSVRPFLGVSIKDGYAGPTMFSRAVFPSLDDPRFLSGVPEPSSFTIAAVALAGLPCLRQCRRKWHSRREANRVSG